MVVNSGGDVNPKGGTNPIFLPNIPQKTFEIEKNGLQGGPSPGTTKE